jgi:hypothetical protein
MLNMYRAFRVLVMLYAADALILGFEEV